MDEQRIESLKLLQDWSKWLIALEAGVCALLWRVMSPSIYLYCAWFMFWGSILAAAFLLLAISILVGQRTGVLSTIITKIVWFLLAAEYICLVIGMILVAVRAKELPHDCS